MLTTPKIDDTILGMGGKMSDLDHARCKACDALFYPIWDNDREAFEDMCSSCLRAVYFSTDEEDDLDYYRELRDYYGDWD